MNRRKLLQVCAAIATSSLASRGAHAGPVKVERVIGKVGRNHGHALVVSPADVMAAVTKTYDIAGTSGHSHEVTITADDFKKLQAGEILRMPATRYEGRGHLHRVLVKTAPAVDPPEALSVVEVTFSGKDDHELVISAPDMAAKVEKTFDMQGIAPHAHAVKLTPADFEKLLAGKDLTLHSTIGDDHTHAVYIKYPTKKP
ncbi:MAG: hypothetical protein QM820_63295 [Minicystis sp.]